MKNLFYLLAIFPIAWEMYSLLNIKKVFEINKLSKTLKQEEYTPSIKALGICMLGYYIWCFIGLFSSQWILFLLIFVLSVIPKNKLWILFFDALLSLIILLFIILNQYHFKINFFHLITN
jgi:hypothetical protein